MIILGNTVISDDLLEVKFCCDLPRCNGACCIEGDAGAPLLDEEIPLISKNIDAIKPFMELEAISTLNESGVFAEDSEGRKVTPLIRGGECVFVTWRNGIASCAIEIAHQAGAVEIQKPVSCHLYPVRLRDYDDFTAVNVHRWHICADAYHKGKTEGVALHRFLKDALIRRFGKAWYRELDAAYLKANPE